MDVVLLTNVASSHNEYPGTGGPGATGGAIGPGMKPPNQLGGGGGAASRGFRRRGYLPISSSELSSITAHTHTRHEPSNPRRLGQYL